MLFFFPIVIICIIFLLPTFFLIFIYNEVKIYYNIKKFSKNFVFNNKYAIWKNKKIRFAIDANYTFSSCELFEAERFIENLNSMNYGGVSNWRIPYESEILELRDLGKRVCYNIYGDTGKSVSLVTVLNKSGFKKVRSSLDYLTASLTKTNNDGNFEEKYLYGKFNFHTMMFGSSLSFEKVMSLWPVSDILINNMSGPLRERKVYQNQMAYDECSSGPPASGKSKVFSLAFAIVLFVFFTIAMLRGA